MQIVELLDQNGNSFFRKWFDALSVQAAVKVTASLARLELENYSNCKSVGNGVHELKIHFGPGYRVYFANENSVTLLLLIGGSKKRQSADIKKAQRLLSAYRKTKRN